MHSRGPYQSIILEFRIRSLWLCMFGRLPLLCQPSIHGMFFIVIKSFAIPRLAKKGTPIPHHFAPSPLLATSSPLLSPQLCPLLLSYACLPPVQLATPPSSLLCRRCWLEWERREGLSTVVLGGLSRNCLPMCASNAGWHPSSFPVCHPW